MIKSTKAGKSRTTTKAKSTVTKSKAQSPSKPKTTKPKGQKTKQANEDGGGKTTGKNTSKRKHSESDDEEDDQEDGSSMGLTGLSNRTVSGASTPRDLSGSQSGASDGKHTLGNTDSPSKKPKKSPSPDAIPGNGEGDDDEDNQSDDEDDDGGNEEDGVAGIVNAVEEDDEDEDEESASGESSGRILLSHFCLRSQRVAQTARLYIRIQVATVEAFPPKTEDALIKMISDALESDFGTASLVEYFSTINDVEKSRLAVFAGYSFAQVRGELKLKAKALVLSLYGISALRLANTVKFVAAMQWLANGNFSKGGIDLGNMTFDPRLPYGAHIIKELMLQQWFSKGGAEGINARTSSCFVNTPIPILALVLTAIENAIKEWRTGVFVKIPFSKANCHRRYRHHVKVLNRLATNYEAWWEMFSTGLYKHCIRTFDFICLDDDDAEDGEELEGFDFNALEAEAQVAKQPTVPCSSSFDSKDELGAEDTATRGTNSQLSPGATTNNLAKDDDA